MTVFASWPPWAASLAWTAVTLLAAWLAGRIVVAVLMPRPASADRATAVRLAPAAARLVRTRVPFWALLVGIWLSTGYWPLTDESRVVASRLAFVIGATSITLALSAFAAEAAAALGGRLNPALGATSLVRNIAWGVIATLGTLVILNGLGVSITPMLTALGVGGLAVALALQEPLANFFAGLFITLAGQIRVGDYIKLESGQEGYVADFSWRSTRLRMLANNLIIVPNAKLAQSVVVNHHLPGQDLAVLVEVGVDYASDLARVEQVAIEVGRDVMQEVTGGVPAFDPFVRFHTFGDSSINFTMILRACEFTDQFLVKHEFVKRLHARFAREHIVIPFPIRTIEFRHPEDAVRPAV